MKSHSTPRQPMKHQRDGANAATNKLQKMTEPTEGKSTEFHDTTQAYSSDNDLPNANSVGASSSHIKSASASPQKSSIDTFAIPLPPSPSQWIIKKINRDAILQYSNDTRIALSNAIQHQNIPQLTAHLQTLCQTMQDKNLHRCELIKILCEDSSNFSTNRIPLFSPLSPLYLALKADNVSIVEHCKTVLTDNMLATEFNRYDFSSMIGIRIITSDFPANTLEKFLRGTYYSGKKTLYSNYLQWTDLLYAEHMTVPDRDKKLCLLIKYFLSHDEIDTFFEEHVIILFYGRYSVTHVKTLLEVVLSTLNASDLQTFFGMFCSEKFMLGMGNFLLPIKDPLINALRLWLRQHNQYQMYFSQTKVNEIQPPILPVRENSAISLNADVSKFTKVLATIDNTLRPVKHEPLIFTNNPLFSNPDFILQNIAEMIFHTGLSEDEKRILIREQIHLSDFNPASFHFINLLKRKLSENIFVQQSIKNKTVPQKSLATLAEEYHLLSIPKIWLEWELVTFYQAKFRELPALEKANRLGKYTFVNGFFITQISPRFFQQDLSEFFLHIHQEKPSFSTDSLQARFEKQPFYLDDFPELSAMFSKLCQNSEESLNYNPQFFAPIPLKQKERKIECKQTHELRRLK